jgi:hypothetical protein
VLIKTSCAPGTACRQFVQKKNRAQKPVIEEWRQNAMSLFFRFVPAAQWTVSRFAHRPLVDES